MTQIDKYTNLQHVMTFFLYETHVAFKGMISVSVNIPMYNEGFQQANILDTGYFRTT